MCTVCNQRPMELGAKLVHQKVLGHHILGRFQFPHLTGIVAWSDGYHVFERYRDEIVTHSVVKTFTEAYALSNTYQSKSNEYSR